MDVHCILIEIFNGKQRGERLLCLPGFLIWTTHALAHILSSGVYMLRHCNARGCGHSVVLMLGHRRQWGHRFGVSWGVPRLRLLPMMIGCYTLPHTYLTHWHHWRPLLISGVMHLVRPRVHWMLTVSHISKYIRWKPHLNMILNDLYIKWF